MSNAADKIICAECEKLGQKSRVMSNGVTTTLIGWSTYYDEEGNWHSHDPNRQEESFFCSAGHRFSKQLIHHCPCGWSSK